MAGGVAVAVTVMVVAGLVPHRPPLPMEPRRGFGLLGASPFGNAKENVRPRAAPSHSQVGREGREGARRRRDAGSAEGLRSLPARPALPCPARPLGGRVPGRDVTSEATPVRSERGRGGSAGRAGAPGGPG